MLTYVKNLKSLNKKDVNLVGGKGASLGEMMRAGIPVPPGFVILATAFNANLDMSPDLVQEIEDGFRELGADRVAVRSSATAEDGTINSWAGQLESYLNTTQENLMENVKKCWASLFSEKASMYRSENDMTDKNISVAVIIQKMIQSESAGVAFSVHPVTQNTNHIIIEAVNGLGESLVSGRATPDSYVVKKSSHKIIDKKIQDNQILSDAQILELSTLIITIEKYYGFPCDIEWALEDGRFYIVQSRPITTLKEPGAPNIYFLGIIKASFWKNFADKLFGPKKIIFEKITRDTTYIMQEIFAYGCGEGMENEYGWKNPHHPNIISYMNEGSIEIWENIRATNWLSNIVLIQNRKNRGFMDEVLKKYTEKLADIHKLWNEKILSIMDLERLIRLSREAVVYYIPYYHAVIDDRTPKEVKMKVLEMWNKDDFFAKNDRVIRDSLISLYPEIGGYETAIFSDELILIPGISVLKERREHSLSMQGGERMIITLSEFNRKYPDFVFKKDPESSGSSGKIRGQIAQKGKVTGKVKILRRRDQIDEVAEGDVIISPMTTTDFLPAILKASAIVTDEGGITSHAAIIARELKKPCIIGTKIATQVLKDGDVVEVDADNGILTILRAS